MKERPARFERIRDQYDRMLHAVGNVGLRMSREIWRPATAIAALGASIPAALSGIALASTEKPIAGIATSISTNFDGEVHVSTGMPGSLTIPHSLGPIGFDTDIKTLDIDNPEALLSGETLAKYKEIFDDPTAVVNAIKAELLDSAIKWGSLAELLLVAASILSRRYPKLPDKAIVLVLSLLVTTLPVLEQLRTDPVHPQDQFHILDGTYLEGTTVDKNSAIEAIFTQLIPTLELLAQRETEEREAYTKGLIEELNAMSSDFCTPKPGEMSLLAESDQHASRVSTAVDKVLTAKCNFDLVLSAGDNVNQGTAVEKAAVDNLVDIAAKKSFVAVLGDHDSEETLQQLKNAGASVLEGKVIEVNGVTVYGDTDPTRQPPYSNKTESRRDETNTQMGERLRKEADKQNPDIVMVHNPAAVDAFLHSETGEIPAKLILNGDTHIESGPLVIPRADGKGWTVQMQLGTAGGKRSMSGTRIWTPNSVPFMDADRIIFFIDKDTKLPTRYIQVIYITGGHVLVTSHVIATDEQLHDAKRALGLTIDTSGTKLAGTGKLGQIPPGQINTRSKELAGSR